jgi:hypothetical protein
MICFVVPAETRILRGLARKVSDLATPAPIERHGDAGLAISTSRDVDFGLTFERCSLR